MDKMTVIEKLDHVCAVAGRLRDALHTSQAASEIDWASLYRELQGFEDLLYDEAVCIEPEGTEGQDRESYADDQDRESYTVEDSRAELSEKDWQEIYYALETKRLALLQGKFGDTDADVSVEAWAGQLAAIMDKIGADGRNMIEQ